MNSLRGLRKGSNPPLLPIYWSPTSGFLFLFLFSETGSCVLTLICYQKMVQWQERGLFSAKYKVSCWVGRRQLTDQVSVSSAAAPSLLETKLSGHTCTLDLIKVGQSNRLYWATGLHYYLSVQSEWSLILTFRCKSAITYCFSRIYSC